MMIVTAKKAVKLSLLPIVINFIPMKFTFWISVLLESSKVPGFSNVTTSYIALNVFAAACSSSPSFGML